MVDSSTSVTLHVCPPTKRSGCVILILAFVAFLQNELSRRVRDAGRRLVVLCFYAEWSAPCKEIALAFEVMPCNRYLSCEIQSLLCLPLKFIYFQAMAKEFSAVRFLRIDIAKSPVEYL